MPLDVIAGSSRILWLDNPTRDCTTLAGAVDRLGMTPVSAAQLALHRAEQIRRNPPSFLFRHRWIAPVLTVSSFGISVAGAALVGTHVAAVTVILAGMLPALGGILLASRKVRGEAYWVEKRVP
ncbi:MAG: hypothetical protein ACREF3_13160, partial [Acetobacteraceae bacterium]